MKQTQKGIRELWIKAQLVSPSFVRQSVLPHLHALKELGRLAARPLLHVRELKGEAADGPLNVSLVNVVFSRRYIEGALFEEDPIERDAGSIPFWRCRELASLTSGDLVIVEGSRHLINSLPSKNAIILPAHVHHVVDVTGDWKTVLGRCREAIHRNELRKFRKYGYEFRVSHDYEDFEEFYYQMYLPTMRDRHGRLSSPDSLAEASLYFRHGFLLQIKRGEEWVAGSVCKPQDGVLVSKVAGVRGASHELMNQAAMSMTYYGAMKWAHKHGYKAVNFLGTPPWLEDGLFRHKRDWYSSIQVPANLHRRIWIGIRRNTPAVNAFWRENPPVIIDNAGNLYGAVFVDAPCAITEEAKALLEHRYGMPGLSSLIIHSVASLAGPAFSQMSGTSTSATTQSGNHYTTSTTIPLARRTAYRGAHATKQTGNTVSSVGKEGSWQA